jgi:xylulose-5-phosphate/fructose-6-phosphate phosphoketolase
VIHEPLVSETQANEIPSAELPNRTLGPELLSRIDAYWRAANYLSVGQIHLYDNPLLKEPLRLERSRLS